MSLNIRTYHELTEADRSGLADQIGAQRRRVADRLASVRRVVAVLSGKGGVGKSFVTAGLARALARSGRSTGVLDADFNGPTIPALLSLPVTRCTLHDDAIEPAVSAEGVRCFSMALLLEDGRPLAFRGPETEGHAARRGREHGRRPVRGECRGRARRRVRDPGAGAGTIPSWRRRVGKRRLEGTMKFLCVECDRQMQFEERQLPGDGTLAAAFRCPTCGRVVALLTNPMETQLVASLGVKIGGTTIDSQPLETVRGMVTTGRDDAFEDGNGETGKGKGPLPAWSREAQERLARVPGFVRGMVKRIYLDYAKDRGIAEITPAVMDTAMPRSLA